MTNEELLKEIIELKKEVQELKGIKKTIPKIPTFAFSKITENELKSMVDIRENFKDETIFDEWLENDIIVSEETENFLMELLKKNAKFIFSYNEDDLKIYFLAPIFNKVDFFSYEDEVRAFYENVLTYETDKFIFKGRVDFMFAKGLKRSENPYFFIQEFKKGEEFANPRPQLLAEMISAVELNKTTTIRGAFIIGKDWYFVILEKLGIDKYQYFLSEAFNSTKIEELKGIYRNLKFVKNEIIQMVRQEKEKFSNI